ncbi:hypothetical protein EV363DRAFT_111379 [Boletus edulis]|nr:hypothetical protein EV363DRAFT_111379 [Boletus edulis]
MRFSLVLVYVINNWVSYSSCPSSAKVQYSVGSDMTGVMTLANCFGWVIPPHWVLRCGFEAFYKPGPGRGPSAASV